MNCIK
jgi:histidinol-phosphate aminotransferase